MIVVPVETEALSVDNILWHVVVWGCFQLSSGSQRISTVGQHDSGDYHGHHDTCRSGQQTSIHQGPWVTGLFLGIISKCKCVCEYVRVCVPISKTIGSATLTMSKTNPKQVTGARFPDQNELDMLNNDDNLFEVHEFLGCEPHQSDEA